jgi:hypothetical protein
MQDSARPGLGIDYVLLSKGVVEWNGWKLLAEMAAWGCK